VAELRPHVDELRAIGVEPYVIGSGTPEQASEFFGRIESAAQPVFIPDDPQVLPVLSDHELVSYAAAGWKRSVVATLHPATWGRGFKSMLKYKQGKTMGDPWQLGGAMIIRRDGEVTWQFRSETAGDHPAIATLVDEARKAVAA
jgi:hypothetical protein